jgi:hypothetical protein
LSASNLRPSRINNKKEFPGNTSTWIEDLNRTSVKLLLNVTSLVITSCESALNSWDVERARRYIRDAKRSYASALRCAGHLSFSVQDVQAFEIRTIRLENLISELERQWPSSKAANYDSRGLEEERSAS